MTWFSRTTVPEEVRAEALAILKPAPVTIPSHTLPPAMSVLERKLTDDLDKRDNRLAALQAAGLPQIYKARSNTLVALFDAVVMRINSKEYDGELINLSELRLLIGSKPKNAKGIKAKEKQISMYLSTVVAVYNTAHKGACVIILEKGSKHENVGIKRPASQEEAERYLDAGRRRAAVALHRVESDKTNFVSLPESNPARLVLAEFGL